MLLYLAGPMTGRIVEKNMSYTVWKEFRFEAAHSLPHLPVGHKCRNKHGHSYRVVVYCTGEPDERGFVVDYAELAAAMEPVLAKLDHRDIDEIIKPSTCENLAKWIWERMDAHEWGHRKPDGVVWVPSLRIRVLVQETPMSGVEYQQ